jgi:hypothetical protein
MLTSTPARKSKAVSPSAPLVGDGAVLWGLGFSVVSLAGGCVRNRLLGPDSLAMGVNAGCRQPCLPVLRLPSTEGDATQQLRHTPGAAHSLLRGGVAGATG